MKTITEPQKSLNVTDAYDVVVAGGGIAGIAAALSAAREGAKTLLIENQYMLGGLATAGLVAIYLPLCDGKGHQISYGICEELIRLSEKLGVSDKPVPAPWNDPDATIEARAEKRFLNHYHPNAFAIQCEQLLLEAGVEILYGTKVCSTIKEQNKITHLILENKSGRTAIEVGSVVDATGDADVVHLSDTPEAIFTHGNNLPAWYYAASEGQLKLYMLGYSDVVDETGNYSTREKDPPVDRYYSGLDGKENTEMVINSHKKLMEHFLAGGALSPTYSPVTISTIPQVRMTRRIIGETELGLDDDKKYFETSVGMFPNWRKRGPVYELPFESLYSAATPNLLCAGRCISVKDTMWDISRVIPVCAVSGEAAGLAAAMSQDMTTLKVSDLQQKLVERNIPLHTDQVL